MPADGERDRRRRSRQSPTGIEGPVSRGGGRNAAVRRRLSVGAVVGVDVLIELPKGNLVDAGGGLDGGPLYGAAQEPLDGSNSPLQFSFPATFLDTVLKTFSTASLDQLFIQRSSSRLRRGRVRCAAAPGRTAAGTRRAGWPAHNPHAGRLPRIQRRVTNRPSSASPTPADPPGRRETRPSSRSGRALPAEPAAPSTGAGASGRSAHAPSAGPSATRVPLSANKAENSRSYCHRSRPW